MNRQFSDNVKSATSVCKYEFVFACHVAATSELICSVYSNPKDRLNLNEQVTINTDWKLPQNSLLKIVQESTVSIPQVSDLHSWSLAYVKV